MELLRDKTKEDRYLLSTLLKMYDRKEIRKNHWLQRKSSMWPKAMKDGFIATCIKNEDFDSAKICEQLMPYGVVLWLIDGGHRLSVMSDFKNNILKLGKNIERPIIKYQVIKTDENGDPITNEYDEYTYKEAEFDIRGKCYKDLPVQLKEKFDNCGVNVVKHLDCTDDDIGYHMRRYNQQVSMNPAQGTITYMDVTAKFVKKISENHPFFKDFENYTPNERNKGIIDRVVIESIMSIFYLNDWQKQAKKMGIYVNTHATEDDFNTLNSYLDTLYDLLDEHTASVFTSKNTFIWLALYDKFTKLGMLDKIFVDFISAYIDGLKDTDFDGTTFENIDKDKNQSSKDKWIVIRKMEMLETLMNQFLGIEEEEEDDEELEGTYEENPSLNEEEVITEFDTNDEFNTYATEIIKTEIVDTLGIPTGPDVDRLAAKCMMTINNNITDYSDESIQEFINNRSYDNNTLEDVIIYLDTLNGWSLEIDENSKILATENIPALVKFIRHTYDSDTDREAIEWFKIYANRIEFSGDVKKDFELMKHSFDEFLKSMEKKAA